MIILNTVATMPHTWVYETREDAGRELADQVLAHYGQGDWLVLAIPRGGVPVGAPIAIRLGAPLDVVIPRKLPVPWDPEAGFGAVTADGTLVLNDELVSLLDLSPEEIRRTAAEVVAEVQRRTAIYRGDRPPPDVRGKWVLLTDDGLASGYTMIAAARSVKKDQPERVIVAVPVAPRDTLRRVAAEVDDVICLLAQERSPFAVASYYHYFPDMSDAEVISYLRQVASLHV